MSPARLDPIPREVYFQAEDGTKLHGWLFQTKLRPPKATIVHFHGNAENLSTHFQFMSWIVPEGYDYFIFDYRGFGKSSGSPSPEGTVMDGRAAMEWVAQNSEPHSKLHIFGQSLGGAVALKVACELKKNQSSGPFDKIIIDSSFHSYEEVGRRVLASSWLTWPVQHLAYLVLDDEYAPQACIENLAPHPLLVVHGDVDQVVDYSLGEEIFEIARQPKEFWRIKNGYHTDFLYREAYRNKLLNWLSSDPLLGPAPN